MLYKGLDNVSKMAHMGYRFWMFLAPEEPPGKKLVLYPEEAAQHFRSLTDVLHQLHALL
jgi:hypothetical protein